MSRLPVFTYQIRLRMTPEQAESLDAYAAHARSGGNRLLPAPLLPKARALGATWALPAEPWHAKRRQHCSAGVLDDLPW
ncbi:MAG: hypothetical protein PHP75_00325 [Methylacidiphilaceae bacterium]|nr:hypothetical protein [Candidatus Methylacidiphilaceae bacterium]